MGCANDSFIKKISLDGEWQLSYCNIGEGTIDSSERMQKYRYMVPDDVHTPLIQSGIIEEPLVARNDEACRWLEEQEFWCSKHFTVDAADIRKKSVITFEGLDCTADVWFNGTFLGRHHNSFVEISYDISELLKAGENVVVVRLDQGLEEVKNKDLKTMREMWNNEQPYRSYMRKPQYVYGWDWTIWLATCGIWKNVYIHSYEEAAIADVYAYSAGGPVFEGEKSEVLVDIEIDRVDTGECVLECSIYGDAQYGEGECEVASYKGVLDEGTKSLSFVIEKAHLWWSNGLGKQYLYHIVVNLKNKAGELLHTVTREFGIRSIEIQEAELGNGESAFTFVLNGVPVFCKGANHVPSDCLFGRVTEEHERKLIAYAKQGNMNMLRIWGGGLYASDALMEACDRAGIMVWHDFMYACGYYPDYDEEFMENAQTEAKKEIKRLRNHASLIGWSGNNEIQGMYQSQKQYIPGLEWFGGTIYEKRLPELVSQYCKNVIYRESSPYGGDKPEDIKRGDQHIWEFTHIHNHKHYLDLWRFTDFNVKFLSEFGIIGAMNLESVQKCIPSEHQNPDDEVWLHHTNSCNDYKLLNMMIDKYFGNYHNNSVQQYILKSQVLQAEITRHIYDEFRCRKFVCSGLLFWTLGDSFGIHNWSIIDYYLQKKPIYYYLRRSMEPVSVVVRGYDVQNTDGAAGYKEYWKKAPKPLEIWGVNDGLKAQGVEMEYRIVTFDGEVLKHKKMSCMIGANVAQMLAEVELADVDFVPEQTVLYACIRADGVVISENRYFFAPFAQIAITKPNITHSVKQLLETEYEVEFLADRFVWMLHVETPDGVETSDNDFDLIPGMLRKIIVTTKAQEYAPVFHYIGEE